MNSLKGFSPAAWWVPGGLVLRLLFMPISAHSDLIFVQYFPSFLSQGGVWDIYGYFGRHYLDAGFTYYPPLLYYLMAFFQWATGPFNPDFPVFMEHVHRIMFSKAPVTLGEYLAPFAVQKTARLLFVMKVPYLVADLSCLAAASCAARSFGSRAGTRWWFDPVLLISTYMIGQYRVISCLAIWVAVLLATKGRRHGAMAAFGVAALLENYPFYLLLPTLFLLEPSWKGRVSGLVVFSGVFLSVFGPLWVSSGGLVAYAYVSPVVQAVAGASITRHYPEATVFVTKILLLTVYAWFLIYLARRAKALEALDALSRSKLWVYASALLLFTLFAASRLSFHYFLWVLPFWVLVRAEGAPWPRSLGALAILLLMVFSLDRQDLNGGLFMPLNADLADQPSLHETMERFLPWGSVVAASRLAFSGLCVFFAWQLFHKRIRPLLD